MKVGVTLPQFRSDAATALAAAREAEDLGLDGVFVFDHLWPIGRPDGAIIASLPLLGALAAETERIAIGSLVARVGMRPDDVLVTDLARVQEMSGGRLIAGLGTGDRLSADENRAFGIPYPEADERRRSLEAVARTLTGMEIPVWIGAGVAVALATREVAARTGAAVNVWETSVATVAGETDIEVTWGGPIPGGRMAMATTMGELAASGATWVVCAWPDSLDDVAAAARAVNTPGTEGARH